MKNKVMKALSLLLAVIMVLSMAACGGEKTPAAQDPVAGNAAGNASTEGGYRKIVIQTLSDPGTFTTFEATSSVSTAIEGAFYETLFRQYEAGVLTPCVGKSYERVGEGVYEIVINEGVHDSKGNAITIDDVVWCYQTVIERGKRATVFGNVKNVEKVDENTMRLTLGEEFNGEFRSLMTSMAIVSKASFEESDTGFASDPVGTGPYKVKSWTQGSSLVLVKNENYWNKETMEEQQPYDEIEYRFISEPTQVSLALETGEVDIALGISPQDVSRFTAENGFTTITMIDSLCRGLLFNCHETNVFSNVKLRQAVCYAIDSEATITAATNGIGQPCHGLVAANDASYFSDYDLKWNDEPYYDYNPEKAKELLAEAGYPGGAGLPTLRIMTKDNPEYRTTCEIMQAYLAEVGIQVEILAYENALYQTYRYDPSAFDMCIMQIGGSESVLNPWKWYCQPDPARDNLNVCMFYDEEFWNLYGEAAHVSTSTPETIEAAWDWMNENVPMYGYGYTNKFFVHNAEANNIFVGAAGYHLPWMDGHAS